MANIRVNNKGKLFFDFYYQTTRCREYTLLNDTAANRKLMSNVFKQIEKEIQAGTFSYRKYFPNSKRSEIFEPLPARVEEAASIATPRGTTVFNTKHMNLAPDSPTFTDFSDQWSTDRDIDWKRSTCAKVADILKGHLVPAFKGRRVSDITREDILKLRTHLAKDFREGKGLSPARINGILNILRQILEEAADRFNFTTPFRGIKALRVPKTDVDPLSMSEVTQFLAAVQPQFSPYYKVAFFTALRTSELNGLKWNFVDFERKQILIRETFVYGEIDTTKTTGSERIVTMSSVVEDALLEQRKNTSGNVSDFVFCASNGGPLNYRNLANRVWHPTLKRLGFRRRKPYQTRHTAATMWLAAGESPEWIAAQMGHTTTRMLFTVYSRYVPNLTRQDGSAFERLLVQTGIAGNNNPASSESNFQETLEVCDEK